MYAGDRVRLLSESAAFGTVLSQPHGGKVSVKLDDGRAMRVDQSSVALVR